MGSDGMANEGPSGGNDGMGNGNDGMGNGNYRMGNGNYSIGNGNNGGGTKRIHDQLKKRFGMIRLLNHCLLNTITARARVERGKKYLK